jgi:dolichol kinase
LLPTRTVTFTTVAECSGEKTFRAEEAKVPYPAPRLAGKMALRLHRGGRFRRWLGAQFGGDELLGDRLWRRCMHALGAAVLVYFVLPTDFFVVLPKEGVLLAALGAVVVLEVARHTVGLELPTLRPYEQHRVGSYVFYALALVGAILLFPVPVAAAVILGTSLVDPLAGEVRRSTKYRWLYPALPLTVYAMLAFLGLAVVGRWPLPASAVLAVVASPIAIAAEWPKIPWVDDDLMMTFVPALVLYGIGVAVLGLPS